MKAPRIALAVSVAGLVALPAVAGGQRPPKPPGGGGAASLSLDARPSTVLFGDAVTVNGRLNGTASDANTLIRLEADTTRPYGDAYTPTGLTTRTQNGGRYTFTVKPALNSQYRVGAESTPPLTSQPRLVLVRLKVGFVVADTTPRRGQRVRFRGTVAPQHDGRRALIQKQTSTGGFRTVARARLVDAGEQLSRYSKRIRIRRDGVYRVKVAGDDDHVDGSSALRTLDVHG